MYSKYILRYLILALLLPAANRVLGADTLGITLQDAEQLFIQKNLRLLAAHHNISIQEAAEIQAKLIDNPEIEFSGNLYNPEQKKVFDISERTGDYAITIQQLIPLAGKRRKLMAIARTHTALSKLEYLETSRGLLLTLRSNFHETRFLLERKKVLDYQIAVTETIASTFDKLQQQKNVTAADALIAKSLLYSLMNEKNGLENRLDELAAEMQILLASPDTAYLPKANDGAPVTTTYPLAAVIDSALKNRPEVQISQRAIGLNQLNYAYEKAQRTPDLTAGVQYERRGGFVSHATGFELGMSIPLFNRNQGNIRAAQIAVDQSKLLHEQQKLEVEKEVELSYQKYLRVSKTLASIDTSYFERHEQLLESMLRNYQKKYLTIQELANFYENYKNNVTAFYELQFEKYLALEELNYFAGTTLFK